jgi:FdhD protein
VALLHRGETVTSQIAATRLSVGGDAVNVDECVAREEPLEIRVDGASFAVLMRTPMHDVSDAYDIDLVRGFLVTENVCAPADIVHIAPCTNGDNDDDNVMLVRTRHPTARVARERFVSSSCGVCGKRTIAEACAALRGGALDNNALRIARSVLFDLPRVLPTCQPLFRATGGVHAVVACDVQGNVLASAEDVGRHNAFDKVVGFLLREGVDPSTTVAVLSGRCSFEMVQKAAFAGIACIASVSAPTSLAVDAAIRLGVTLAAFVRDGRATLYAHPERVV